jgi:superfamily II DNA/RNA helicase
MIRDFDLFINYDAPSTKEIYIKRLGTSGHLFRRRISISFITPPDKELYKEIESYFNTCIDELPMDLCNL